ncbi:basic proline-rich protein-like [Choloepus didactylus]|uniref:basic proline-rich protein-like n=1 Tax=Choloepus didactylus TaxID=27675 RepID=UPI00189CFAE7|nr:basic proline-rich protein-like [Choloepus didactylus]
MALGDGNAVPRVPGSPGLSFPGAEGARPAPCEDARPRAVAGTAGRCALLGRAGTRSLCPGNPAPRPKGSSLPLHPGPGHLDPPPGLWELGSRDLPGRWSGSETTEGLLRLGGPRPPLHPAPVAPLPRRELPPPAHLAPSPALPCGAFFPLTDGSSGAGGTGWGRGRGAAVGQTPAGPPPSAGAGELSLEPPGPENRT